MLNTPRYRVVQWTTGNVGKSSVEGDCGESARYELVGCYAWSPEKVGHDVGELCGIDPLGIAATNDVDALLAAETRLSWSTTRCGSTSTSWRASSSAGVNVVATAVVHHRPQPGRRP